MTYRCARGLPLAIIAAILAAAFLGLTYESSAGYASVECVVRGSVIDAFGQPVPGIHVRLARGNELLNTTTDAAGQYDFEGSGLLAAGSQPLITVELIPQPGGFPAAFRVLYRQAEVSLLSDSFVSVGNGCRRDFDMRNLPYGYRSIGGTDVPWADVIEIYHRTALAWELADRLGLELGTGAPLAVYGWCDDSALGCWKSSQELPDDFAGFAGSKSDGSYTNDSPFIVYGVAMSALASAGRPDNREYHEMGHYVLSSLFANALPLHPLNTPHGGYFRNPSSSDSWVEGFAEFYSVMVSKYIDGDSTPERYRLYGAEYDIELDHRAWEWAGWWEELAVAGILLDFEDGDGDYLYRGPGSRLRVESQRVWPVTGGYVVAGNIRNRSTRSLDNVEVVVELIDDSVVVYRTAGPAVPGTLDASDVGRYIVPLPAGVVYDELRVAAGPLAHGDDDPIEVPLSELLGVIAAYESEHEFSNGYLFDVSELYRALSDAYGGRDRDGDGQDDVDQIFVAHGVFADLNGNRLRDEPDMTGEAAGMTSHPAADGFPDAMPRFEIPPAPEGFVTIDTGGVATDALVNITFAAPHEHRSYGYVMRLEAGGRALIAAPPQGFEATVTVVALADGYLPAIAGRFAAADLWALWEQNPGQQVLSLSVAMQPGGIEDGDAPEAVEAASGGGGGLPGWLYALISGSIVTALGYGLVFARYGRGRRL